MARANLNIHEAVANAFLAAQESRTVRILQVKIQDEDLILNSTIDKAGTVIEDFNELVASNLEEAVATFVLFNLTDEPGIGLRWLLITWIPDGCRVRDKMLYSSSREDLKRNLGLGYFKGEYVANLLGDLRWEGYLESQRQEITPDILTEKERLILEEKVLSQAETGSSKSSALGVIPFDLTPEATQALDEFKDGHKNWIELTLAGEVVQFVKSLRVTLDTDFGQIITADSAVFVAVKLPIGSGQEIPCFIFYCPEIVPIRTKMTMSSAKAAVIGAARDREITFEKFLEVRDVNDVDSTLRAELNPASNEAATAPSSNASKPQRPGKGRAKVSKFQADE